VSRAMVRRIALVAIVAPPNERHRGGRTSCPLPEKPPWPTTEVSCARSKIKCDYTAKMPHETDYKRRQSRHAESVIVINCRENA
jgi:hypothetical protein